jgi:arabinogalactan endo-1,4-beta-galactosidase
VFSRSVSQYAFSPRCITQVLAKAKRGQALGSRLLIDFHYSDTFADPGRQTKPAAWQNYTLAQLMRVAAYTLTGQLMAPLATLPKAPAG